MIDYLDLLSCPDCAGNIRWREGENEPLKCSGCPRVFGVESGIPLMYVSKNPGEADSFTEIMKSFYEENPFPNYDGIETAHLLDARARRSIFARMLDEEIPLNASILEVGCGTGQMSNFLGLIPVRAVIGTDICVNSLRLASDFSGKIGLRNVRFLQMNLFKPVFREESFDYVICTGVLHHTDDPYGGFKSISRLVRKGGYIIIGLYNKYGGLVTDMRRILFRLFGDKFMFLDPRLRGHERTDLRKRIWFMDQYKNPHESKHTMGEVLRWFRETGFDFISGIPRTDSIAPLTGESALFKRAVKGDLIERAAAQLAMMFRGSSEGGLFLMVGRKV